MEFFTEQNGRYDYNALNSGSQGGLLKIITMGSLIFSVGILALVYYLMKYRADSSEALGVFPVIAAMFVMTDLIVFFFLRRKLGFGTGGGLKIDYMQGLISFKSIAPMFSKKVEIRTGEINDLTLVKNTAPAFGFANSSGMYSIRITTVDRNFDILSFRDIDKARKVGSELASIVSRSLKDMT